MTTVMFRDRRILPVYRLWMNCSTAGAALAMLLATTTLYAQSFPGVTNWPERVPLKEESFAYRPVGATVIRGMMYGPDLIQSRQAVVLVAREVETLCLAIDSRDGVYSATGRLTGQFNLPTQLQFTLVAKQFPSKGEVAVLAAWAGAQGVCAERRADQPLIATAWNSAQAAPSTLNILVNSGGLSPHVLMEIEDHVTSRPCTVVPEIESSKVYDAVCVVDLCEAKRASEIGIEIRNFGQRTHLEKFAVAPMPGACGDPG